MRLSLPIRAALTIVFILTLAVAMTGILSLYQLRSFSNEFLRDKMVLVLAPVRESMETSLALGLPLRALPGAQRAVRNTLAADSQILSVEFFAPDGNILYSSDESLLGDLVAEEWTLEWDVGDDPFWTREERDAKVIGLRVEDALGVEVGSLALRYSRAAFDDRIREIGLRIGAASAAVLLLLATLGAWLSFRLTGGIRDLLLDTHALLAGERSAAPADGDDPVFAAPRGFAAMTDQVLADIREASTEVSAIEEGPDAIEGARA